MRKERTRNKDGTFAKEDVSIYIGKKYGRLTVLEIYPFEKYNFKKCKCICECGNIKHVYLSNLKRGYTKSCGCTSKNNMYEILVGQRFGRLVVVEQLGKNDLSQEKFKCLCDCGNYIEVYGVNLLYKQTMSCGCIKKISAYNNTIPTTNKSGIKGVHYSIAHKKWVAKLVIKGKAHRKEFNEFNDAVKHRKYIEDKYHGSMKKEYLNFKKKFN